MWRVELLQHVFLLNKCTSLYRIMGLLSVQVNREGKRTHLPFNSKPLKISISCDIFSSLTFVLPNWPSMSSSKPLPLSWDAMAQALCRKCSISVSWSYAALARILFPEPPGRAKNGDHPTLPRCTFTQDLDELRLRCFGVKCRPHSINWTILMTGVGYFIFSCGDNNSAAHVIIREST